MTPFLFESGPCSASGARLFRSLRLTVLLLLASCASHPAPNTPPPTYPAVPEAFVQFTRQQPSEPYAKLRTVTIQESAVAPSDARFRELRQTAAQLGANLVVIVSEKSFSARNEATRQPMELRRTVYELIYRPGR